MKPEGENILRAGLEAEDWKVGPSDASRRLYIVMFANLEG